MTKLCRDCRYCDLVSVVAPRCDHPRALTQLGIDLVDGRSDTTALRRCAMLRASPLACGIEGEWWEPRSVVVAGAAA